jgi:transposase
VRPRLTWTDRALLAALLTLIPRSRHGALRLFITPATILRWHRDIVRRRWAAKSKPKRPGRPPTHRRIVRLVLRMAADNEHWGYRRIAGELAGLGIAVAPSTVWEILKRHGIDPAPRRPGPGVALAAPAATASASPGWQLTDQYTANPACYTTSGGSEPLEINLSGSWSTSLTFGASALPAGGSYSDIIYYFASSPYSVLGTGPAPMPAGSSNGTGPFTVTPAGLR